MLTTQSEGKLIVVKLLPHWSDIIKNKAKFLKQQALFKV
jgi:hypothetical protein